MTELKLVVDESLAANAHESSTCAFLQGELDIAVEAHLRRNLTEAIRSSSGSRVFVDVSGVTFIDSTALNVFVRAQQQASQQLKWLVLVSPSVRVVALLRLTGLTDCFEIVSSPDFAS